jgi:hypothetical protein
VSKICRAGGCAGVERPSTIYAGVGIRLRSFMESQRELLDPAVAEVLEPALSQDMRDYYTKVYSAC